MPLLHHALPNHLRPSLTLTSSERLCPPAFVCTGAFSCRLPFQINFAVVADSDSEDEHDYEDAAVHHYP